MLKDRVVVMGIAVLTLVAGVTVQAKRINVLEETGSAFSEIAKSALPAVVFIDVESTIEIPPQRYHYFDPFEEFFGRRHSPRVPEEREPRKYSQQGQGSGFIISKDGYILTNNHVVKGADRITVTMRDGKKFTNVKLIGTDPKSEVALIKIDNGEELPYLNLGDSGKLEVGEWVLAAGNPFGLSQTVTAGIVSAKERSDIGIAEYGNFIQTDAAINPGNSGGPLLNIDGEVVGINTAIYTRTGGYMGIGFAIPINMAIQIKDQLIAQGKVLRSVLGIFIQEVDADLASSFGIPESGGILISQVVEDSAAEEAGIEAGDIVVEMDGKTVQSVGKFRNRVASTPPNTKVRLRIFREGKYTEITAVTKAMEGDAAELSAADDSMLDQLGLSVENLDHETGRRLGYADMEAVLITEVEQGSPAWRTGLKPGHVITSVNQRRVANVAEFRQALAAAKDSTKVLMRVGDGRAFRFVVITLD